MKKAKYALEEDDYAVLLTSLKISESTASKYVKIAKSDFCTRLYSQQRLPENWTTMYEIALVEGSEKLDQSVKDEVLKSVNHRTTKDDLMALISKLTGKVKKAIQGMFTFKKLVSPRDFLKISVEDNDSGCHPSHPCGCMHPSRVPDVADYRRGDSSGLKKDTEVWVGQDGRW